MLDADAKMTKSDDSQIEKDAQEFGAAECRQRRQAVIRTGSNVSDVGDDINETSLKSVVNDASMGFELLRRLSAGKLSGKGWRVLLMIWLTFQLKNDVTYLEERCQKEVEMDKASNQCKLS